MTSPYWSRGKWYTRLQGKNTLNDGQATFAIGIGPKRSPLTRTNQTINKSRNSHKLKAENATSYLTTTAVESAINALEAHGLDRCPDHGIDGFKRYIALAVLARNIQRLGVVLKEQEAKRRRGPYKKAA